MCNVCSVVGGKVHSVVACVLCLCACLSVRVGVGVCASHMAPGLDWRLWHAWEEDLTTGESGEGVGRTEVREGREGRGIRGEQRLERVEEEGA